MKKTRSIDRERGQRAATCARCGGDAEWIYVDNEQTRVEVTCPDCGKMEMSRAEFDQTEDQIIEPADRE